MNQSLIFLILLLTPIVLSTTETLHKIDRTPEGKVMLDNLFVQMKLMDTVDEESYTDFFAQTRNQLNEHVKESLSLQESHKKECEQDKTSLGLSLMSHEEKSLTAQRSLTQAKTEQARHVDTQQRLMKEYENYASFAAEIQAHKALSEQYYTSELEGLNVMKKILQTIHDIITHPGAPIVIPHEEIDAPEMELPTLEDILGDQQMQEEEEDKEEPLPTLDELLTSTPTSTSFVQLERRHYNAFTQVKVTLRTLVNDSTGLEPVVTNLIDIMNSDSGKLEHIQTTVRAIVSSLLTKVIDRIDQVEEELVYIRTLFERLEKTFTMTMERGRKELEVAFEVQEKIAKKVEALIAKVEHMKELIIRVEEIIRLRMLECEKTGLELVTNEVKMQKTLSFLTELEDLMQREHNGFRTFFLQTRTKQ